VTEPSPRITRFSPGWLKVRYVVEELEGIGKDFFPSSLIFFFYSSFNYCPTLRYEVAAHFHTLGPKLTGFISEQARLVSQYWKILVFCLIGTFPALEASGFAAVGWIRRAVHGVSALCVDLQAVHPLSFLDDCVS
jgi:hypothetical protein